MANYFNTLPLRLQLEQLGKCRFMSRDEFASGCDYLKGKKIVIVGCGAQGLNQGLNTLVNIANKYHRGRRFHLFTTACKGSRRHKVFHNLHAIFVLEGNARDFIESN